MIETHTAPLTDADLIARFLDTSLPTDAFRHRDHVRMAWLFVTRDGLPAALESFPAALRRFAEAKGASTLYHATITWAYLLVINERQQRAPAPDWSAFAAANPDLLSWKPSILDRFYTAGTLWSEEARRTFLLPDRLSQTD
jgi:hypothetical protein